jgi:hypothetical protein
MTTKMIGPDRGAVSVEIGGREHRRQSDGTFHVDAHTAKLMRATGDFGVAGTRINGKGYTCQDCNFVALLSDSCGRCGGSNMKADDA